MKTVAKCWVAAAAMILAGCGSAVEIDGTDTDTDGSSSSASTSGSPTSSTPTTNDPSTSSGVTTGGVTTTPPPGSTTQVSDDSSSDDGSNFITPETGDSGPDKPQPNGAQCVGDDGCVSGFCYLLPQGGGVCSECLVDQDCEMGTCAINSGPMFAACTDGSQGLQCNTDEGCAGDLVCSELIDTGGFFNASFCSECNGPEQCGPEQFCAPEYDLQNISGSFNCVDAGMVEIGGGCPLVDGDGACASGHCTSADLFGFAELALCGECSTNEDCPEETPTCAPAEASMNGITPSTCE